MNIFFQFFINVDYIEQTWLFIKISEYSLHFKIFAYWQEKLPKLKKTFIQLE